jgi:hypothetical protein
MNSQADKMTDPILEEIWRVREELLKRYGGIDGYFKHRSTLTSATHRRGNAALGEADGMMGTIHL